MIQYTKLTLKALSTTIVVFYVYKPIKEQLLETKCVFKHQDFQMFGW